jgi:hypothetical protein
MLIASWNVNSIRARAEHVKQWLQDTKADVLFLQELKGSEFPTAAFEELGYHSVAVTQKAYNGVAILSRTPIELVSKTLLGDELDSHARFLEVMIEGIRLVNIYLPNGNPIGTDKFAYKLAWMDRLALQMKGWLASGVPIHLLRLFSVGFPTQSRHSKSTIFAFARARASPDFVHDRQRPAGAAEAFQPYADCAHFRIMWLNSLATISGQCESFRMRNTREYYLSHLNGLFPQSPG